MQDALSSPILPFNSISYSLQICIMLELLNNLGLLHRFLIIKDANNCCAVKTLESINSVLMDINRLSVYPNTHSHVSLITFV